MVLDDSHFKRLFELSGDAMMVLGESAFIYCNPAALTIYACPSVEVFRSKHPADLSPPYQPCGTPSRELAQQHIRDAMRLGHKRFEWVHTRLTGEEFYSDVLLSPADWHGEKVIQAIVRDISAYKALQDSLRREKEQSEIATRAKSEFLAVMSHEIRTPIHGILGAQELLMESRLDREQRQLAGVAIDSTRRLLNIVNDVLDFSKIEAGKLVLDEICFSPQALLAEVRDLFHVEAANKSVDFSLQSCDSDPMLNGDANRIRQILSNLVSNAIKFTDAGGNVRLVSQLREDADGICHWHIAVTDTGIGMTEAQQRVAFDVFTQADSSISRSYGGTGLGLSISRALAQLLGGSIELRSEVNRGSVFDLKLPLARAPSDAPTPTKPSPDLVRNYQASVLVAEDNPTNRFIIEKKLERLGLQAVVVENGLQALEQYEESRDQKGKTPFAAILMDVQMPIMNGIDATLALRMRGCREPIFALTADVQSERKQQCIGAGMQAFIGKPYEELQLIELFDQYLETPAE